MGRRGWVSVLTVNHCSAHNLQPKRYLPSKLMSLVHSRMRQSTTSSNMVVLGNIWEQTAETSVWLAVVRKWSGSFLATAHFVFWRQRYKQRQALLKAAAVPNLPTSFICENSRKDSWDHVGLLSHTRGSHNHCQPRPLWIRCRTMHSHPTRHASEGGREMRWGCWHQLVICETCLLTLHRSRAEISSLNRKKKIFLSVNRK